MVFTCHFPSSESRNTDTKCLEGWQITAITKSTHLEPGQQLVKGWSVVSIKTQPRHQHLQLSRNIHYNNCTKATSNIPTCFTLNIFHSLIYLEQNDCTKLFVILNPMQSCIFKKYEVILNMQCLYDCKYCMGYPYKLLSKLRSYHVYCHAIIFICISFQEDA